MKKWDISMKPAEYAEYQMVDAILTGEFAVDSFLPGERELAETLGVTRPTLREVLQRMARDGWVDIQHGKPTRVKNYFIEGNLGVLSSIALHKEHVSTGFTADLLVLRRLLAPDYTRLAVEKKSLAVIQKLKASYSISDKPAEIARYDWELHHTLAVSSQNPVFPLLLNGFVDLYQQMGIHYYSVAGAIALSRRFYEELLEAANCKDAFRAETICQSIMIESEQLWHAYARSVIDEKENSHDVME